ncbi:hypothetical protein [Cecembia rubra]|uniref:Uncharacterized protein n=1 Tax=Cecembia rubra TaxID=1485585 RepID=A0A2P8DVM6_9BACT|nr:hypothetical protein [Cecembia rubra]PSL01270.1 hypothetical protein CLV48_11472 [Cecembia rubra]
MPRILLITLFFIIVLFQIPGEKVPVNEGTYGHGLFFRQVAIEFVDVIDKDSYNIWQLQHIFPFALVHMVYVIFGLELEPESLLSGMVILNFIFLGLAVFWFFRIMKKLHFEGAMEALAFVLLFFNFFLLKEVWYNPFSTDMAAFCLGLAQVNYFIRYEKNKLFLSSFVGAFVSPFLLPIGLLLMVLPGDKLVIYEEEKPNSIISFAIVVFFAVLMLVLAYVTGRFEASWLLFLGFMVSLITLLVFLYWVGRSSPINWSESWKIIGKKLHKERILIFFGGLFVVSLLLWLLSGSNSNVSLVQLTQAFVGALFRFPLDFLAGHLMFFGLIIPLSLVFLYRVLKETALLGIGFTLAMVILAVFALHPNSGTIVPFLPLLFLGLMKAIRRYRVLWKDVWKIGILNLILSMFWVRLNVPGLEEAFEKGERGGFPAQRYWMHFGDAQDLGVMVVVLGIFIGLLWLLEKGRRRYVRS